MEMSKFEMVVGVLSLVATAWFSSNSHKKTEHTQTPSSETANYEEKIRGLQNIVELLQQNQEYSNEVAKVLNYFDAIAEFGDDDDTEDPISMKTSSKMGKDLRRDACCRIRAITEFFHTNHHKLAEDFKNSVPSGLMKTFDSDFIIKYEERKGGIRDVYLKDSTDMPKKLLVKIVDFCSQQEKFYKEAVVLSLVDSPNVIKYYGAWLSHDGFGSWKGYHVLESMDMDLLEFITQSGNNLDIPDVLTICLNICEGLAYLHKYNIFHRDIKLQNIFYNRATKTAKIGDFGDATISDPKTSEAVYCTQLQYAPEEWAKFNEFTKVGYEAESLTENQRYHVSKKADIWRTGKVFLELICGNPRDQWTKFSMNSATYADLRQTNSNTLLNNWIDIAANKKAEIAAAIRKCLTFHPKERPKAHNIFKK